MDAKRRVMAAMVVVLLCGCAMDPDVSTGEDDFVSGASPVTGLVTGTGGDGLRVRAEPTTKSTQVASLSDGDEVTITCQTKGEHVDGTDVWNRIAQPKGYVLSAYVDASQNGFVDGLSKCSGVPKAQAETSAPSPAPSSARGFTAIWGGKPANVTQEFLAEGGPALYGYGTAYGLNGTGHTGIDVGIPYNTTLYTPKAGVITCAGTGDGPGAGNAGCAAFNDTGDGAPGGAKQGVGRIEIELEDGTVLILGHSRTSFHRPGARVAPGDSVGSSGGMLGAHVHVEARVRDASMSSGWRIIDPRTSLGK